LVSGSKKNIFEKIKYALLASCTYRDAYFKRLKNQKFSTLFIFHENDPTIWVRAKIILDLLVSGSKKNIFQKIKYALLASSIYRDA